MIARLIRAVLDMRLPAFMDDPKWTPYIAAFGLALFVLVEVLLHR